MTRWLFISVATFFSYFSNAQTGFEKYYNTASDNFSKMPDAVQDTRVGLNHLLEIEKTFNNLPAAEKTKYQRRMGDTYMITAGVLSIQNNLDSAVMYMRKAAEARNGDLDVNFINGAKMYNNVRNHPGFKKVLEDLPALQAAARPDLTHTKMSAKKLKKDLDVLKQCLEEAHQGMYTYSSKKEMDVLFKQAAAQITTDMPPAEFYGIIAPLVAAVKDGHTSVYLPYVSPAAANRIPLQFAELNGKLYVRNAYLSQYAKYVGKEVKSINGQPAQTCIDFALRNFTSDGNNTTHKLFQLQYPGKFANMLTLVAGKRSAYEIVFASETLTGNSITRDSLGKLMNAQDTLPPIDLTFRDDNIAVLTIRSFAAGDYDAHSIGMKTFLTGMLALLKDHKTKNLIVDLRGNGGGEDVFGRMVFQCFARADFTWYRSLTIKQKEFKMFNYVEGGARTMPAGYAVPNKQGTLDVQPAYNGNVGTHQPYPNAFTGNLVVLVDGGCFSTTSELLAHLQAYTKAVFVGQESGGNSRTNNSGIIADVNLPNSQLTVGIPMLHYVMNVPGKGAADRGVMPDYELVPEPGDWVNGKDRALEKALEICK